MDPCRVGFGDVRAEVVSLEMPLDPDGWWSRVGPPKLKKTTGMEAAYTAGTPGNDEIEWEKIIRLSG